MSAPIGRIQTILSGFPGAPGLMNFYWNGAASGVFDAADATAAIAAVRTMLYANRGVFPAAMTLAVQPSCEVFDANTGALLTVVQGTSVATISGSGVGNVLTAEGPLIQWITGTVVGRRLLRGRTFLTPSVTGALDSQGSVLAANVAIAVAAGVAYAATTPQKPVVWHRPIPFKTGNNGIAAPIAGCTMPAKVAVLRSRRD